MIKIPIKIAWWNTNIAAGGTHGKSLAASTKESEKAGGPSVNLWYLGHGVLVEHKGHLDKLIPIGSVATVEAAEETKADEWAGYREFCHALEVAKIDRDDAKVKDEAPKPAAAPTPQPKRRGKPPKPKGGR